jgi:pimeloyl-ACP methyl ester carboxylesterase
VVSSQALDCEFMTGQFARDLNIPNDYIHILEDSKHFLWEDNPDDIARLIANFVQ